MALVLRPIIAEMSATRGIIQWTVMIEIDDAYLSQVFRATTAFMAGGRDLQAVEML